jgi:hypothetical protein
MGKRVNVTLKRVGTDGRARRATASEKVSKQEKRVRVKQELYPVGFRTDALLVWKM